VSTEVKGAVTVELPNKDLHSFKGFMNIQGKEFLLDEG